MEINTKAPAIVRHRIQIAAGCDIVWEVLTDLQGWPAWNKQVESLTLDGPLAPGSNFEWKAGPGVIRSTLAEVDPPRKIAWTGQTFGIKAIDVFRLEEADGSTFVSEDESWDGLLVRFFTRRMQHTLRDSIEKGLQALKIEAERRASSREPALV